MAINNKYYTNMKILIYLQKKIWKVKKIIYFIRQNIFECRDE